MDNELLFLIGDGVLLFLLYIFKFNEVFEDYLGGVYDVLGVFVFFF